MASSSSSLKVLFIVTSHDQFGDTGHKTGFFIEEFATPYYILIDKGINITIASPKGGRPPMDPTSESPDFDTVARKRFYADTALQQQLSQTLTLKDLKAEDYDGVFYPGGHGPVWDLANDDDSIRLIEGFFAQKKPVGAICHGQAVLVNAKDENGESLVKGKGITSFSKGEEEAIGATKAVPFLLEDKFKELGGRYSCAKNFEAHAVEDGLLVTGQNPASSEPVGLAFLKLLQK